MSAIQGFLIQGCQLSGVPLYVKYHGCHSCLPVYKQTIMVMSLNGTVGKSFHDEDEIVCPGH